MADCIFCKIVNGELPSKKVYETDTIVAFEDVRPQAPVHILVIPKEHIPSIDHLTPEHRELAGDLQIAAGEVARMAKIDKDGYRVIANVGFHGQQTVPHLHYHVIGGRQLQWPPG